MELCETGKGVTSMPKQSKEQEVEIKVIRVFWESSAVLSQQLTINFLRRIILLIFFFK